MKPPTLEDYIRQCDALWPKEPSGAYNYTLGPIGGYWAFSVVRNWHRWSDAKLQHRFTGSTPLGAILAFLEYVRVKKIDVTALTTD